jgi:YbgC/YbaW family acyl-CoA thioester hydrolase
MQAGVVQYRQEAAMNQTMPGVYRHPVTVEFEDVDSYGMAHHTKLVAYLERARAHFFADHGLELKSLDFGVVLLDLHMHFKQPLQLFDQVTVEVRVRAIGRVRFTWDYVIFKGPTLAAQATIEQAVVALATKRPMALPAALRQLLETILIS